MTKHWIAGAAVLALLGSSTVAGADDSEDWAMYNGDPKGARFNSGEHTLTRNNVSGLHQIWNVPTPAPVTGTPVVVQDELFVGDWGGNFYKVNAQTGQVLWTGHTLAPISASALVKENRVIVGDQAGFVYAFDRATGSIAWQILPNPHPTAAIFGSPTMVGPYVAVGTSSNEEQAVLDPSYTCCSFRGSMVLIDPRDGQIVWQTFTISNAEAAAGSSGSPIWSSPTYDAQLGLIFATTGNNYNEPTTGTSDSVIAFDAATGGIQWVNQRVPNDYSNFLYPPHPDRDNDFGDSPQIYKLASGQKVVGAGNKNGQYTVLDASTGALVNERQLQPGGPLGGLFADSATAYGMVFHNGANWPNPFDFSVLPIAGYLTATTPDGSSTQWQFTVPNKANLSGVAVANEVVYFASLDPGTGDRLSNSGGTIFALDAYTGAQLAAVPVNNCASSGPAVSRGRVFFGLGNMYQFAAIPPGAIVGLGL